MRTLLFALAITVGAVAQSPTFTVLHRFTAHGAAFPVGELIVGPSGALYGITAGGGPAHQGTAYRLTPPSSPGGDWTETVLCSFLGPPDGKEPSGKLAMGADGVLYGTTLDGGSFDAGTAFSLTPPAAGSGGSWTKAILWNFGGTGDDGANPTAGMTIGSGGVLYGTTQSGGEFQSGAVFALTPPASPGGPWSESVIWAFTSSNESTAFGPIDSGVVSGAGGILYGTTFNGGENGLGAVYSLTPPASPGAPWTESVLWSFTGGDDGRNPMGNLRLSSSGTIYGITSDGGKYSTGVVFSLTPPASPGSPWTEAVLQTFLHRKQKPNYPMGAYPDAGLIFAEQTGVLYGTTSVGGLNNVGVIFRLGPPGAPGDAWQENRLHSFNGFDGWRPWGLTEGPGGLFYGVTNYGGGTTCGQNPPGCGTVFALKP
jgi:uncharacterized repeat protein (TIGR03803 family)